MTGTGSLVSKTPSLLTRFAILALAGMDDSIKWRPPFEEMEFEFLEFSLVGSHWLVFSARFSNKSHPSFSSFCKNLLGTCFLRGFWLSSLNRHKEFDIIAISLFYDEDIGQGGLWYLQNGSLGSYLNCMMFFLTRAVL